MGFSIRGRSLASSALVPTNLLARESSRDDTRTTTPRDVAFRDDLLVAHREGRESGLSREEEAAWPNSCQAYRYPLYAFMRRRGYAPDAAEDLTQEFFADLLSRGVLEKADRTVAAGFGRSC